MCVCVCLKFCFCLCFYFQKCDSIWYLVWLSLYWNPCSFKKIRISILFMFGILEKGTVAMQQHTKIIQKSLVIARDASRETDVQWKNRCRKKDWNKQTKEEKKERTMNELSIVIEFSVKWHSILMIFDMNDWFQWNKNCWESWLIFHRYYILLCWAKHLFKILF